MHYKNGREAKNGDKIVLLAPSSYNKEGKPESYKIISGILYDAIAGNDYCNGRIAPMSQNDACPNLKECLHLEDFLAALSEEAKAPAK